MRSSRPWVVFAVVLTCWAASACSQKRIKLDPNASTVEMTGVMTVHMEWMKVKSKKFETSINFTNNNDRPILVWLKDLSCEAGGQAGHLSTLNYENSTGLMTFRHDESKNIIFRCTFDSPMKPPYQFTVGKVFGGNGHTVDKPVAKNLVIQAK